MNTVVNSAATGSANKTLWAAVAVLGIAVLAMGATLIRVQSAPTEPRTAVLAEQPKVPEIITETQPSAHTSPTPSPAKPMANKTAAPNRPAAPAYNKTPQVLHAPATEPAVARAPEPPAPVKSVCANCAVVQRVTAVEHDGAGTGLGAVAGGVLGAVVGNQVGGGDGKTLATILGAVGGGLAGNTVEKKMKKVTLYDVTLQMDDGSTQTLQQTTPPAVGARVTVNGDTLHPVSP